jgi:hypothetical protein
MGFVPAKVPHSHLTLAKTQRGGAVAAEDGALERSGRGQAKTLNLNSFKLGSIETHFIGFP